FLASTRIARGVSFLEHVRFEFIEPRPSRFNFRSNARIPRRITLLHEFRQAPVFANGGRNLQSARKGIHSADVRVEKIDRLKTFAPHLGVKIDPARAESPVL